MVLLKNKQNMQTTIQPNKENRKKKKREREKKTQIKKRILWETPITIEETLKIIRGCSE